MRSIGHSLFGEDDLRAMLLHSMNVAVREAVFDLVMANPAATRLDLRQAASGAATLSPLTLGEPAPAVLSARSSKAREPIHLSCTVAFTGEGQLFRCSVPIWPAKREVKGTVGENTLVLTAEGWTGDDAWLPAVLGAELQEIRRILAVQAVIVRQYGRLLEANVRALVERVDARMDRPELMTAHHPLLLASTAETQQIAADHVTQVRQALWRKWTR